MNVHHHPSGMPLWTKLLIGFILLKVMLGLSVFPLLFWGALVWFVFARKGNCMGLRHGGPRADFYEKRKNDMYYDDDDYSNGKAKREDIVIV